MQILKNKTLTTITLVLILIIATILSVIPIVSSQTVEELPLHIFVSAQPVTGIDQTMSIIYWTDQIPPDIGEESGQVQSPSGRAGWYDITLTITQPDGTEQTLDMPYTDPIGGGFLQHAPTQVGEYSVVSTFPGSWKNTSTTHTWYPPNESAPSFFTVQSEPIATWSEAPLPTNYWMRPISGASRTWHELAGNWLGGAANVWPQGGAGGVTSNYGYGSAPGSAHILWTYSLFDSGSLVDERFGSEVYTLNHYHSVDFPSIIVNGKIHYELYRSAHYPGVEGRGVDAGWGTLSLYTGEQLFLDYDATPPEFGQIYVYKSPNQHGAFEYLWRTSGVTLPEIVYIGRSSEARNTTTDPIETGTLWEMIDAFTGNNICYVANVSSSGTAVYGKEGSLTYYNVQDYGTEANPDYYLQMWNSSAITDMLAGDSGTTLWMWRPSGGANGANMVPPRLNVLHDGSTGWSLNMSVPLEESLDIQAIREGEYVIFGSPGRNDDDVTEPAYFMAVSLEDGKEGTKLWDMEFTPPYAKIWAGGWPSRGMGLTTVVPEEEVVIFSDNIQLKWCVYDIMTGEKLWESESRPQMEYYSMDHNIYEDMLLASGFAGGVLTAYDLRTGEIRWEYIAKGEGTESPYGNSLIRVTTVSDGKVYLSSAEHSATTPLWRTPGLRCLNLTTGEEIWKILFWGGGIDDLAQTRVADGILIGYNLYDGQVYAFGKGPSATTVTVSPSISVDGSSVLIKGTVTDQTPTGRRNINNELQFSLEGTPAISDEDMAAWMEYKFMGQALPEDAKGVTVKLTAIDPNGNFQEMGEAVTDINGNFGKMWNPPVSGEYYITATFEGSESYWPSDATTYMGVTEAPEATPPPDPTPGPPTETYITGSTIAILAGIAIAVFLILRKK